MKSKSHIKNHLRTIPGGLERPRFADELAEYRSEEAFKQWGRSREIHPPVKIHLSNEVVHVVELQPERQARES